MIIIDKWCTRKILDYGVHRATKRGSKGLIVPGPQGQRGLITTVVSRYRLFIHFKYNISFSSLTYSLHVFSSVPYRFFLTTL